CSGSSTSGSRGRRDGPTTMSRVVSASCSTISLPRPTLSSRYWFCSRSAEHSVFEAETLTLAKSVLDACRARGWHVATAESCTGGLVAGALTAIAGSSDVVERGFVAYSNEAKSELLGVPAETIASHGAVSAETTAAMAEGAVARSPVDLAVSVTGVAGPGGGSVEKPIGLIIL